MKTPRDILFARHQNAAPKLDAIRRELLSAEFENEDQIPFFVNVLLAFWRELIWPCRRIWAGLAAIWVLIFAVNFSQRDKSEMMAGKTPLPSPEMILVFGQQERLLAELTDQKETPVAEPPKLFLPQPRSEGRIGILMT
jgi:hypothetical protein